MNNLQRGQAYVGSFLVFFLVYMVLIFWIGMSLVQYIVGTVTGSTLPGIIALILAFVTGFNILIPATIVVWILSLLGIFHHTVVSLLPFVHHFLG